MLSRSTGDCLFVVVVGLAAGYFVFQNENEKVLLPWRIHVPAHDA